MEIFPRATEKTYLEQSKRTYAFFAPLDASKQAIAAAVADQFKVTVTDIRVLIRKGKKTKFSKGKHAYPGTTFRRDHKLAYVTLKEGDKIAIFEEQEPAKEEKPAKKADQKEAKATKADKADKKDKKGDK